MKRCKRCLLPATAPGADIDSSGACQYCRTYKPADMQISESLRIDREADLERCIAESRGQGEYDCLVCLSGGKDSVYLLYKLKKEYGQRVLAYTTDIDIGDVAWNNIRDRKSVV